MKDNIIQSPPTSYRQIEQETKDSGFTMASDLMTGSLLCTLAASKPSGKFLELGTGTGLSTSWILNGMDDSSELTSVDHDARFISIADKYLHDDKRLSLVTDDGEHWVNSHLHEKYDYIFADTWHGKYLLLDEVLAMLNKGGLYIIDDMLPQPNWPEEHPPKVAKLIDTLDKRTDLHLTKLNWSTGIIIAVKR